jgi:hypothetical protein
LVVESVGEVFMANSFVLVKKGFGSAVVRLKNFRFFLKTSQNF